MTCHFKLFPFWKRLVGMTANVRACRSSRLQSVQCLAQMFIAAIVGKLLLAAVASTKVN